MIDFKNAHELLDLCAETGKSISEIMIQRECENTEADRETVMARMKHSLDIMKESVKLPLEKPVKSIGGLIGGEAVKLDQHRREGKSVCGSVLSRAITYSMGVLEVNTSMGLIVAAPTAGSSGIIPGLLMALQEEYELTDDQLLSALFNAAAVGYLATRNATVSGAVGGCQAEVGVASAMAASAAVEVMGGTPKQCTDAASTALMNLLGLVCDPIAGLVECPCQSRNAIGVSNSLSCAEIALSGIEQIIPLDEMLEAMMKVGKTMPGTLKETALGGCAMTETGCRRTCEIFGGCQ